MPWIKTHGWRIAISAFVFGLVVEASVQHGRPNHLPSAALDWTLLFHTERAVALLAVAGAVLLVGWRALHGEFPVKFGQLEYQAKEAASEAQKATEAQEQRLQLLEAILGVADPPPGD